MNRAIRLFLRLFVTITFLLIARGAYAAAGDVKASADATKVGLGDRVQLHLVARSSGAMPTDPGLGTNSTIFEASAGNARPTQSISFVNGSMSVSLALSVDWTLLAKRVGTATFLAEVKINGKVVKANPVTITVVPAGQAPAPQAHRPQPDPFGGMFGGQNPFGGSFDPFGALQSGVLPDDVQTRPFQSLLPLDPKLAMNTSRAPVAFLHSAVDKSSAVVGEQVTYSVYLYSDREQQEPDFNDWHEPSAVDFVKQRLIDDNKPQALSYADVGGKIWNVQLMQKWALFPLKTGLLEIGPMRAAVVGGRGGNSARTSESLVVKVDDAPIAGRPPGYVAGTVGVFDVTANVAPRDVDRGGTVGVDVSISGTGNVPSTVTPPPQQGVDWLEPEVRDDLAPKNGVFGGSRSFSFVVHMNKRGAIDLGEIAIPYFDPDKHVYGVARAPLGIINVKDNGKPEAADAHDDEPLQGLPALKDTLAREAPRRHLADRAIFWAVLLFCPLSFVIVATGRSASRRLRGALEFRRASPESLLSKRIADAKAAGKLTDARALDAAIAKMIEQATIVRADVNVRALTLDETEDHLAVRGVKRGTAEAIVDVLRACEEARFLPEEGNIETSRERLASALAAIEDLRRHKDKSS